MNIRNSTLSYSKFLNVLLFCFPVAHLAGNASLNVIIILSSIIGLIGFSKDIYVIKNESFFYLITFFFLIIIISTIIDSLSDPRNDHFFKSIAYLRYFFFFLVASYLVNSQKFNFKIFIISSLFCSVFLSLDIIFQFFYGVDLLGNKAYEKSNVHLAGFLKDDYIAGAYIQKFFIFGFIFFPFISNKLKKYKFVILIFLTVVFFLGILLSGNRMPIVMYIFSIFLMFILIKDFRLPLVIGLFFCSAIFIWSINNNQNLKDYYSSFYVNAKKIIYYVKTNAFQDYPKLEKQKGKYFESQAWIDKTIDYSGKFNTVILQDGTKYNIIPTFGSGHAVLYITALDLWMDNPLLGNGIKSFRVKCLDKIHLPSRACESHPHNYYLEILNDSGIIGAIIFLLLILIILKNKLYNLKTYKKEEKLFLVCMFIIIISEFFPLKSTGSFFSIQNSSYIFFILGMLSGLKKIKF